jgi:two-component system cell cycle sensor histidine kinase PleC
VTRDRQPFGSANPAQSPDPDPALERDADLGAGIGYDDVFDLLDCGVSIFDKDLLLVKGNAKFRELLDFPEELCRPGTPLENLLRYNAERGEYGPGNAEDLVAERMARARLRRVNRFERVRPDGTIIDTVGKPVPDGGIVTTYISRGIATADQGTGDISFETLKTALDYTSDGFHIWDRDGRLIYANARIHQMGAADGRDLHLGLTYENHLRLWIKDKPVPAGFASHESFIDWRLAIHKAGDRAILQEPSPGSWVLVRDHVLPDGKRLTTVLDVTELKRAERKVSESEQRFRDFVDASSDRFWETDTHHRFTALADTGDLGFAPPVPELLGHTRWEYVGADPLTDPKWAEHIQLLTRQEPFRDFRYTIPSPQGELRNWRVSGVPVFDQDGNFRGHRGTATDESDASRLIDTTRQELEQALQNAEIANRAKTLFLATVSHELRTPLNAIIGFADLVREQLHGTLGDPRYLEYVGNIRASGTQLHQLIEDVLDMSRVEMGQLVLRESWIDLCREVSAAADIARNRHGIPPHRLTLWLPETPPALWADARMIRQVAINLISNAIKFSGDDCHVEVDVTFDDDGAHFGIKDNGVGIDPDEIDKILRPFEQADARLSRTYEGLGLGLPLARAFVELHDGTLGIESTQGEGTRLRVNFPAARVRAE